MMRKKRYNLSLQEEREKTLRRMEMIEKKEKVYVSEPVTCVCDNTEHPMFTIKVTVDKPVAACYYCSKTWILEKKNG